MSSAGIPSYFRTIGLDDLADEDFRRIGTEVVDPGTPLGARPDRRGRRRPRPAARHRRRRRPDRRPCRRHRHRRRRPATRPATMAYVFGTSSCTMTTTARAGLRARRLGPLLLGHDAGRLAQRGRPVRRRRRHRPACRASIPAAAEAATLAAEAGARRCPTWLAERAGAGGTLRGRRASPDGLHVVPEFLGNRAPFADPHARAVIAGLGMERGPRQPRRALRRRPLRPRLRPAPDHRDPGRGTARPSRRSSISGGAGQPPADPPDPRRRERPAGHRHQGRGARPARLRDPRARWRPAPSPTSARQWRRCRRSPASRSPPVARFARSTAGATRPSRPSSRRPGPCPESEAAAQPPFTIGSVIRRCSCSAKRSVIPAM